MRPDSCLSRLSAATMLVLLSATSIGAHEAWLLTPAEIEALSQAPIPPLFRSQLWLGLAAAFGFALTHAALRIEPAIAATEDRVFARLRTRLTDIGPLAIRFVLAAMLLLAAAGGLPRHGTPPWTTPTLLVPDMQLSNVPNAEAIIAAQIVLAVFLIVGAATRLCGLAMIALSLAGLFVFGPNFWSYAPHFAAPGLILIALGAGRLSFDNAWSVDPGAGIVTPHLQAIWRAALVLIGAGFVYLGIAYKLLQPTLLIAILEHGDMPTFGMPMPIVALAMTGVEILCGALLVVGRLVRPVALAILAAITFLAVILGETPLFHANLYGALLVILLAGRALPQASGSVRARQSGTVPC